MPDEFCAEEGTYIAPPGPTLAEALVEIEQLRKRLAQLHRDLATSERLRAEEFMEKVCPVCRRLPGDDE